MVNSTKIYANAVAKYNEGKLLDKEKIRRLADADFSDAVKILCDYGYGGGIVSEQNYDIDKFIAFETAQLIEYVNNDSPNKPLARCLTNRFLYSNAKCIYKNKFVNVDLSTALYVMPENKELMLIEQGDYSLLPEPMAEALEQLNAKFADSVAQPKLIDFYLSRAMYADSLACAKDSRSKIMQKYVKAEIDLKNIITILRCKNLGISPDVALDMLYVGGELDLEQLVSYIAMDYQSISIQFKSGNYSEMVERLCESGQMVRLEAEVDDFLYDVLSSERENMLSLSPFLSYFTAKLTEFKTVKMILVCLKNNAREEIFKRLRALFS